MRLSSSLPERSAHDYNLRLNLPTGHDRSLNVTTTDDKNFLSRMLFKDIYW